MLVKLEPIEECLYKIAKYQFLLVCKIDPERQEPAGRAFDEILKLIGDKYGSKTRMFVDKEDGSVLVEVPE